MVTGLYTHFQEFFPYTREKKLSKTGVQPCNHTRSKGASLKTQELANVRAAIIRPMGREQRYPLPDRASRAAPATAFGALRGGPGGT